MENELNSSILNELNLILKLAQISNFINLIKKIILKLHMHLMHNKIDRFIL